MKVLQLLLKRMFQANLRLKTEPKKATFSSHFRKLTFNLEPTVTGSLSNSWDDVSLRKWALSSNWKPPCLRPRSRPGLWGRWGGVEGKGEREDSKEGKKEEEGVPAVNKHIWMSVHVQDRSCLSCSCWVKDLTLTIPPANSFEQACTEHMREYSRFYGCTITFRHKIQAPIISLGTGCHVGHRDALGSLVKPLDLLS